MAVDPAMQNSFGKFPIFGDEPEDASDVADARIQFRLQIRSGGLGCLRTKCGQLLSAAFYSAKLCVFTFADNDLPLSRLFHDEFWFDKML